MLDPRLYRAAFAPLLLALVVAAFSLVDRPRAIQTTLAPDAFDGAHAMATLQGLAEEFPHRRPGGQGDRRLADHVAGAFRSAFCPRARAAADCSAVQVRDVPARTIDGERDLRTVVATRLGEPGPGIVVLAHRDAAGDGAEADLSGTAALLELARIFEGRSTRRTLTLVSTSGGSGGLAGARQLAQHPPEGDPRPDAVLVLGNVASREVRRPWVLPWSTGDRLAPVQLRRTVETALRTETGQEPGAPRAPGQLARLAFPFAQGEEGPFNDAGIPAVLLQASGDRRPDPGAAVSAERLRGFGRATLRTIDALDNGPTLRAGPGHDVVLLEKVLPGWVVRMLVGFLLLPAVVGAVDALARVRRRRLPVAPRLRWLAALALPFLLTVLVTRLLGVSGLLDRAVGSAVPAGTVGVDGVALAAVVLVFVLGVLAVRPAARLLAASGPQGDAGAGAAVAVAVAALAVVAWLFNPFAAAVLVLPAHLWLIAGAPEARMGRAGAIAVVLLALVPAALVLSVFANATATSLPELPWQLVLLTAGGQLGWATLLGACVLAACAVGAAQVAATPPAEELAVAARPSIRGPLGYAGPGSLGGTESSRR